MATQKTVTVIGYSTDPEESQRAFANRIDPDERDLFEQEEKTTQRQYIRYTDDDGEEKETFIDEGMYDAIVASGAFDPENDRVSVVKDVETELTYTVGLYKVTSSLKSYICDSLPEEIGNLSRGNFWTRKWQDDAGETHIDVSSYGFGEGRIMKHQSTRTSDDRFETDEEWPSVKFEIEFDGEEEEVEAWSQEMVPQFIEAFSSFSAIGKVRISDCKTRVEKEGECFDAL